MWPSLFYGTSILSVAGGGNYTGPWASIPEGNYTGTSDDIFFSPVKEELKSFDAYDSLYIVYDPARHVYNALKTGMKAVLSWKVSFPNGRNYTPPAGNLGLGPTTDNDRNRDPSILEKMKENGTITSMFCGLHVGSAAFGQRGSMMLGGYEQNRVLGEVGTFDMYLDSIAGVGGPRAFLLDVILDVELGISPFISSGSISLWHAINDSSWIASRSEIMGGRTGSRLITLNPTVPYMYLPPGICEIAARYLPLTWDAGLGLYVWEVNELSYRIISSPAFMAIILADNQARNITIKIPFQLLNLTLSSPIVDTPVQYFPCQPLFLRNDGYDYDTYVLGRAFLQAAFLGFEYEHNLTYIAQAPGPSMEQSIIKTYQVNDTSITPGTIGSFASSWESSWTILKDDNSTNTTRGVSDADLSGGARAGIGVGSATVASAIAAALIIIWRRKRRILQNKSSDISTVATGPPLIDLTLDNNRQPSELCPRTDPSEAYGNAPPHEMVGPNRVYEVSCEPSHHQLPNR